MAIINPKTNLNKIKFVDPSYGQEYNYKGAEYYHKNPTEPRNSDPVQARVNDLDRMATILSKKPGINFLGNQAKLVAIDNLGETDKNALVSTTAYTSSLVASILGQTAINGSGVRINGYDTYQQIANLFGEESPYYLREAKSGEALKDANVEVNKDFVRGRSNYESNRDKSELFKRSSNVKAYLDISNESSLRTGASNEALDSGVVNVRLKNRDYPTLEGGYGMGGTTSDQIMGTMKKFDDTEAKSAVLDRATFESEVKNNKNTSNTSEFDLYPIVFSIEGEDRSILPFRGFLNTFNSPITSNWNTQNYVGRSEPVYTYLNSQRTLELSFSVPIFGVNEQYAAYQKINSLMSHAYPFYDNNLPQGTITKIRVGDLFKGFGVMTSVNFDIKENVPYSDRPGTKNTLLPQVIDMSVNFNVIHEKMPQRYIGSETKFPYIANVSTNERVNSDRVDNLSERGLNRTTDAPRVSNLDERGFNEI